MEPADAQVNTRLPHGCAASQSGARGGDGDKRRAAVGDRCEQTPQATQSMTCVLWSQGILQVVVHWGCGGWPELEKAVWCHWLQRQGDLVREEFCLPGQIQTLEAHTTLQRTTKTYLVWVCARQGRLCDCVCATCECVRVCACAGVCVHIAIRAESG